MNTELPTQLSVTSAARSIEPPYFQYVGLAKARTVVRFATPELFGVLAHPVPFSNGKSSLRKGIKNVIGVGAEKQVVGPNAAAVITVVANEQALGDRPVGEFVGDAVGALSVATEHAVSSLAYGTSPEPTIARLINLRPKAFGVSCGTAAGTMPTDETVGLAPDVTKFGVGIFRKVRGLTTTTLTKMRAIGRWYTRHCQSFLLRVGRAEGRSQRRFGFFVPKYSTSVRGLQHA